MRQQYDSYKPSGIDWIGDIPSHWNIRKTSQLFQGIGSGTTPTSGSNKYYCDEGINWLQTGDLNDGQIIETSKKITELAIKDFSSLRLYPKASIVIAMYGATIGKLGILNIQTTTNQACCVLPNSKGINQNFGFYAYRAGRQSLINSAYGGGQPNISQETIKSFRIALPPLAEQQAIAAWLDEKCGEIDAAIAKVDREIELIDELKQSEISRVVTRGLNPDAPLRPSGIDWINEIPFNWSSMKLKHTVKNIETDFMDGDWIESNDIAAEGIRYLTSGNIGAGVYKEQGEGFITEETFAKLDCIEVFPGDLLISRLNEPIARTCFIPTLGYRIVTCVDNVIYRPKLGQFDKRYMMYQLNSKPFWFNASQLSSGATMQRISRSKLGAIKVIVPPLSEQQEIADFLDKKCAEIDRLKAKLTKKRETLTELRQSIISEVVTGKRKVI